MSTHQEFNNPGKQPKAKDEPDVSVDLSICILNWNGSALLAGCLRSVREVAHLNQTRLEVIVVDNGSTDDSVEMVRRDFPEARLLTNGKNISVSAATNQGLRLAKGNFSLILNNDIILLEDCLDQMVHFLESNPKAGIVSSRLLNPDGTTQVHYYLGHFPTVGSVVEQLLWVTRLWGGGVPRGMVNWNPDIPCRMEQVPGACMMVQRAVFEQIGFWDERFTCWYEDVDFCLRAHQAGWEIWYIPTAQVIHYGGSTVRKLGISQQTMWRFNGLLRYSEKHFSGLQNAVVRFVVLATLILRLPIVVVLRFWPQANVRRIWKGTIGTYLRLISKLSYSDRVG